jgi:hypothetical protein
MAQVTCKVCNKPLKANSAVAAVCGARCSALLAQGVNAQVIATSYKAYCSASIPVGFITIATVHILLANNPQWGCSVSRMVQATGGDRPYLPNAKPAHPICKPVILQGNKTRWLHPWLGTQAGAQAMATGNFTNAPKLAVNKPAKQ